MHTSKLSTASTTSVLSDIPLLCIGVMGIGIFTFLFLVKKVRRMGLFLHGSSFLTFVAATLDLSRVVTLSRTDDDNTNANALVIAREILLSLAYPLLNLYLWELVVKCPRSKVVPIIITKEGKWHVTSWDRWDFPGEALKWASLAALFIVPVLQLVWRLVPGQRQPSAIYNADSVLETTLSLVFILKLLSNAYGSTSKPFWPVIRPNFAPIMTLLINLSLSVGNLPLFELSDSPLGRFLYAIGIYILLLYNLYENFQDFVDSTLIHNKRSNESLASSPQFLGKENARTTVLDSRNGRSPLGPKSYSLSDLAEQPNPPRDVRRARVARLPNVKADCTSSFWVDSGQYRPSSLIAMPASTFDSPSSSVFKFSMTRASTPLIRPDSSVLTSGISCSQETQQVVTPALEVPSTRPFAVLDQATIGDSKSQKQCHQDDSVNDTTVLRELSPPCSILIPTGTTEDTRSHDSTLSVFRFPDPPSMGLVDAVDSNGVEVIALRPLQRRRKRFNEFRAHRISGGSMQLPGLLHPGRLESRGTQWDVTSFIGNLTMSSRMSMYTQSGVGPAFPRTYSQLVTSPILESLTEDEDYASYLN